MDIAWDRYELEADVTIEHLVKQGSRPYCVVVAGPMIGDNNVVHLRVAGSNISFRLFPPLLKRLMMDFIGITVAPFLVAMLHRTCSALDLFESLPGV